jgi:hypothetical protein
MKNNKITILFILIFFIIIFISNYFLQIKTDSLINEKYSNIADKIKSTTKDFIDAKSEANLFIALSLAHDKRYVDSIVNSTKTDFDLDSFSEILNKNTEYKNVWIQISDYKGISIYRNWLKEKDDDGEDKGHIFFEEFLIIENNYYPELITYLSKKFLSFFNLIEKAKKIQEIKLQKYGVGDRLNATMTKFVLINQHNWKEKSEIESSHQFKDFNIKDIITFKENVSDK